MSIGKRVQGRLLLARDVPDAHALLNVGRRHAVAERDNKLGDLLNVDQVPRLVLGRDDLGAAGHLLFVCAQRSAERTVRGTTTRNACSRLALEKLGRVARTCSGCSSCIIILSACKSHRLGGASPVSVSLTPVRRPCFTTCQRAGA